MSSDDSEQAVTGGRLTPAIALVSILAAPAAMALGADEGAVTGVFVASIVVLWVSEALPLAVTALLVPSLSSLFGIQSTEKAFASFGSPIVFLLVGSFMLAQAMRKHSLDQRFAFWILSSRAFSRSLSSAIGGLTLLLWLCAMWMSNTVACSMFLPVFVGVAASLRGALDARSAENLGARLALTCAFFPSIGGLSTPIGSIPNAVAVHQLGKHGLQLAFFDWMMLALPVSILLALFVFGLLSYYFPVRQAEALDLRLFAREKLDRLGPVKMEEKQVMACFAIAVCGWVAPGLVELVGLSDEKGSFLGSYLAPGTVAICSAAVLFALPATSHETRNLTWDDAKAIDWGTVMLFGGGLCLGAILDQAGLSAILAGGLQAIAGPFVHAALAVSTTLLSEIASNTASAAVIVPIALSLPPDAGSALELVFIASIAASFGYALPISTPPNAMAYGTGLVRTRDMLRVGLIVDLVGVLLLLLVAEVVLPAWSL